ncbi:MAG: DNA topoisomerase, partial [bacterium]
AEADPVVLVNEETRPPARFTESTLLSAMEGAGKLLVNDDELREAMAERGLGTPATRAATIEGLISQKYLLRDGRDLHVTPSGLRLIDLVQQMEIEGLYSPMLTGDWEYKLRQMEQGQLKRPEFMKEIIAYTNEIVAKAHRLAEDAKNQNFSDIEVEHPIHGKLILRQTDATYESRDPEL